jgi:hypothetical protein
MENTIYKNDETATQTETERLGPNLQEWLHEVNFKASLPQDLDGSDIERLGQIIARLLCLEPSARASAREVLDDPSLNQ